MKKLLIIFVALTSLALLAALAGIMMSGGHFTAGPKVLVWKVGAPISDYAPAQPLSFLTDYSGQSLATLYRALGRARGDESVAGVALYIQGARFGLATAQELHGLVTALRHAGKFAECYLETAGEGGNGTLAYYLATACEHIALAPAGDLNLLGLYSDSLFVRGALEKLRIDPEVQQVGEFKSASELYTHHEHSPAAELALAEVLDSLYPQILAAIAEGRDIPPQAAREVVDRAPYTAREALGLRLVDELAYPDQFRERLRSLAGDARLVDLEDYAGEGIWTAGRRLAVVFAQGTILRGESGINPWTDEIVLGSDDIVPLLERLAEDRSVAAVVLRIDSPGGSALASDLILRAADRLAAKKPLVASLSDVAASGGYYIATRAHRIVADPATITGSIGVWGGKFVTERFQRELLGLTHDTLKRGANADIYSSLQPFSPDQAAHYARLMRQVYDTFLTQVAEGRRMSREDVEVVAEGRIWTGAMARERRLVDELGGLERAIDLARERAGLDPGVAVHFFPKPPRLLELLLRRRSPLLRADVLRLLRGRDPQAPLTLELPPELARLAQPF